DRDFLGGLRKLDTSLMAGWAFLPNAYTIASGGDRVTKQGPIARLTAQVDQPRLWSPNFGLTERVEVERALEPAYSYFGGREKLGITWQPWTWLSLTPSYNFEAYRLDQGAASL